VKFAYIRNEDGCPVGCIAWQDVSRAESDGKEYYVEFNYSTHNPRDRFSKAIARQVASGRFFKQIPIVVRVEEGQSPVFAISLWLKGNADNNRMRKAAKRKVDFEIEIDPSLYRPRCLTTTENIAQVMNG
jgi:hypothetical protein